MGGALGRRECWQRRRHWEWRPQGYWRYNWGIHSVPCQGSEGCSARGEMLLPLQQPRALYLLLHVGEGIPNRLTFKLKGGDGTKEGSLDPSRKSDHAEGTPRRDAKDIVHHTQSPFLNPDPFHWWYGIKNVARVRINRESCMALLDNDTQINTITLGFVENHSLDVGSLSDLVGAWVAYVGLGNALTQPMGYVVIRVQVDGVQGCGENQIALVILDLSNFMAWVPIILGTAMISHVINMIKDREIDALAMPWVNTWVAYLSAVWWATDTVEENDKVVAGESDSSEYDEVVTTKDTKTIDAFLSHIIHARTGTAYTGVGLNVMTQALHAEDGPLPQGLTIQNAYTELCNGNKNVAVVVRNSMVYPQTLRKKTPVARAVAATWMPEPPMWTSMIEALDEAQCLQMPKLTLKQRQEKLFEELDLSGLESTQAGGFCPVSLGWVPWCLLLRAQQTQLYSFNWTCDPSHQ